MGDFAWSEFLTAAGLGDEEKFIVVEKTAIPRIAALYNLTPMTTLQAWEAFTLPREHRSAEFRCLAFSFPCDGGRETLSQS